MTCLKCSLLSELVNQFGVKLIKGDIESEQDVKRALKDKYGAFVDLDYWTLGFEGEIETGKKIAKAAKEANIKHLVFSYLDHVELITDGKFKIRQYDSKGLIGKEIKSLGLPYTFAKYSFYYENLYEASGAPRIDDSGNYLFSYPLRDKRLAMCPARDAGRAVAKIFKLGEEYIGKEVGLAGSFLTGEEISQIFSKTTGLKSMYIDLPDTDANMGKDLWQFKREYETRYEDWVNQTKLLHPGILSFEDWLKTTKFCQ
eukprot:TRINITY_DN4205_c0_g1_i1.p1 TRINITY_DN4205_c0_g1~~TRINITY_DN4205_c0_g1_i1.p1  ORF type:complete len:257 (-),score=40.92 TRINITY_DN4205_c0_g1_i1:117-887(-)